MLRRGRSPCQVIVRLHQVEEEEAPCQNFTAAGKYPYFPGQEPTLPGDINLLLQGETSSLGENISLSALGKIGEYSML
ncbi:hypothetical protein RchiOBHm_Chr1g0319171 [Rosa chinensis]|uniref:Uncharacterized protein n=1 Tax=Rosa chinensis TaxID=74649 RepID=A0A2P6S8E1_ROSCH|nr:hypothetical protein RchiOBHm_Chr1g0319171 [Rosa chinensis]